MAGVPTMARLIIFGMIPLVNSKEDASPSKTLRGAEPQGGKANAFNRLLTSWNSGSTSIYHHCGGYDNNGYRRLTFGWNDNDYDESCDHSSEDDGCDNYDERGYHYRRHRRMTDYYWGGSGSSDSKDSSDDYKPSCDQSGGSTDNSESSDSLSDDSNSEEDGLDYLGCFTPIVSDPYKSFLITSSMTVELCFGVCTARSSLYFALDGETCACGYDPTFLTTTLVAGICHEPCPGDDSETCGGADSYGLYKLPDDDVGGAPTPGPDSLTPIPSSDDSVDSPMPTLKPDAPTPTLEPAAPTPEPPIDGPVCASTTDGVSGFESSKGDFCCTAGCGQCGGSGCGTSGGADDKCCTTDATDFCDDTQTAPCIIEGGGSPTPGPEAPTPTPEPEAPTPDTEPETPTPSPEPEVPTPTTEPETPTPEGPIDGPVCASTTDGVSGFESSKGDFCCTAGCGQCGGSGCGTSGGADDKCCTTDATDFCDDTQTAPCIIEGGGSPTPEPEAPTPSPELEVPTPTTEPETPTPEGPIDGPVCASTADGISGFESSKGDICCTAGCGQCGGSGCGTSGGADDECCTDDATELCNVTQTAPCIIDGAPTPTPEPEASTPSPALVNGEDDYSYVGCYGVEIDFDPFYSIVIQNDMTPEICFKLCVDHAPDSTNLYFGLLEGNECGCGDDEHFIASVKPAGTCDMSCTGNPSFMCGGTLAYSLFNVIGDRSSDSMYSGDSSDSGGIGDECTNYSSNGYHYRSLTTGSGWESNSSEDDYKGACDECLDYNTHGYHSRRLTFGQSDYRADCDECIYYNTDGYHNRRLTFGFGEGNGSENSNDYNIACDDKKTSDYGRRN